MGKPTFEIRCVNYRGERYYYYVTPGLTVRAQDHNYLLRVVSDKIAILNPKRFSLLPESKAHIDEFLGDFETPGTSKVPKVPEASEVVETTAFSRLRFDLGNLKRRAHRKRRPLLGKRMHFQLSF